MDWNAKLNSVTLQPMYPKKQSSLLEPSIINTPSQVPLNTPGSNHPACMFRSNSYPVSQSPLNIRNTTSQQISASDKHSRTIFASQASLERKTYANVKGPNQLNNSLQMSPGVAQNVWANSPVRNSMFSHTGAAVSQQTGFRTNPPNVNALQNQFVTSEIYPMQGQTVPSNSVRVPVTYQGHQRLTSSLSERQADWAQQYTSNGLTYADYRPRPEQYSYPPQSFLQSPTLQKQNTMQLTSVQVKNSNHSNSALTLQSKQTASLPSYQIAVIQNEKRLLPPYDCRYTSQTLQNTQHVINHSSEVPQSQEVHTSEMRKDFCRSFQQQNLNENVSITGNFCNMKVNTNVNQPVSEPTRSVDDVQILPQNNQEERVDFSNLTSSQVLDTNTVKEKLVKDIKQLVEMRKKFSELARKIKINKNVLMLAGCTKANSETPQNSELSLKQTGNTQFGPHVTPATPETAVDKSPKAVEIAEETNRMHSTLNSNIQETNCRNSNQVNSISLNSVCLGKGPVPDQLHNLKDTTSFKMPTMDNTQFSSGNTVNVKENVQTNSETILVSQSMASESYASKYLNENRLLISLLAHSDEIEKRLMKDGCETIKDSNPHSFKMNANTQITNNQLNLKTMETPSSCNINANVSENSFCLDHKFPKTGVPLNADSHLELLATCLNLWKKNPSEPTEKKQCNELTTQRTAVGISKAGEICDKTPVSLVGYSQNKMENCSQVTTLPMAVQSYESPGATTIKGTELQIAVVSPLISDIKTLPVNGITPDPLPETVYPVIKEGSVCSLQNQLAENTRVTAVLKVNEPVTTNKVLPLSQKEKRNTSTNGNSEDAPNTNQGNPVESEPNSHCPVSDQQASSNSKDNDTVSSELLQIDNICSLVEGDTSYNYQIAKIFNSPPIEQIESQKSLPNLQVISTKKQKEQLDNITEKIELGLQKDNFLQYTDVLYKIPDQSKSPQPLELYLKNVDSSSENPEENNLKHYSEKVSTAKDMCSSAALNQDSNPQEIDVSCNHTAQDSAVNEVLDNTSIFFPHNQLSELSKEFPYGIEPVTTHEDSSAKQITDKNSKDESCDKTSCDSKDATDDIKITILNSEQMKELFPEQNDQSCELDKFTNSQKENLVTKNGIHCVSPVHTDGESSNFVMDSEKDDVRCCALGWLSNVYEGVPQCQCKSINNLTSKVENIKDQCSLETSSCKQVESTSDKDYSIVCNSSPNNNPKIALTFPIGKNPFSETEQGRTMKDLSEPKCSSLRTEQELSTPSVSKGDKKLDSLKCHKKKRKLKFHELTFHSSAKRKFSQESLQRKIIAQNSSPPKAKPGFSTNKDLHIKNGSFVQKLLPEKIKLETGDRQRKVSAKRKLGEGSILNSEVKKMKYFKQEQNKNGDGTLKTCTLLSNPDGRAKVKEKTVSNIKSLGSMSKDNLPKVVITLEQYLQRQKHKEAMGVKASKLNCEKSIPCDSQSMRSSKLSMQVGSSGKSDERHSSSVQTSEESLSICSSHDKNTKIHHSHVSKSYLLGNAKETVGGKQPDKMFIDKTKLDKNLNNINNGGERNHLSPQAKEQRKQYLNRVAFKCIEQESICLTKLESLPKNINKEKRVENKPLPQKNTTEKQSMLEFKLCPDGLINKKINSTEEQKDLQPCPRKEQAPVQVTGIKSSKEDWIKGAPEEKRIPEANQEIGVCNSEPLLVRFRRLHSNPRGSLLYATDGIVLDKAAGTKRGPDELSSACITTGPISASAANGNDRKKFKGDSTTLKGDSKKLNGDNKLKIDSKKLNGDSKLKIDSKKLNGDNKLKIDSKKLKCDSKKLKGDSSKLNGDNKLKGDREKLMLKGDREKLKLKGDSRKSHGDKLKIDSAKLKGDGSKLNSDSKKTKGNSKNSSGDNRSSGVPSRVICIGKLPGDVTEDEVIFLGLPFGKVTNFLMMKWRNQAFIEMNTEEAAITMVNYYTSMKLMLRGQPIYIQFSHQKELNTSSSHNQAQVQSALQALNSVKSRNVALAASAGAVGVGTIEAGPVVAMNVAAVDVGAVDAVDVGAVDAVDVGAGPVSSVAVSADSVGTGAVCSGTDDAGPADAAAVDAGTVMTGQSPVLRIILENLSHPFSLDMLHQIFSNFGRVLKITTFTQNNMFEALLQFAEPLSAELAKVFLDSWNIFGCTVRVSFSTSSILNVKYNSSKSRVYTYPDLSWHDSQSLQDQAMALAFSAAPIMSAPVKSGAGFPSTLDIPQAAGLCDPNELQALPPVAIPLVSGVATAEAGQIAIADPAPMANHSVLGASTKEAGQIAIPGPAGAGNCVLLVKNLNPERITIQNLFIIFGVYGDVQRAKIFFKNKTRALVQMADGIQAQLAMSHLNGHKLHGKPMLITVTPYKNVHLLHEGQADLGLTKDYSNSPLHRFRNACSKKFQNVFPPSENLYLSQIPPFTSTHNLKALFSSNGRLVKKLKFFKKCGSTALITMGSVEEAIQALIDLHYYELGENHHLWVTFAKIPVDNFHLSRKQPLSKQLK